MTKKERLEKYLKYKGIKPTAFARALGISNSHISEINTRKNNRTLYLAIQSSPDFLDLNTEWIDTGKGEMLAQPVVAEQQEGYARQLLSREEDYLIRTFRKLHLAEKEKVIEIAELYSGVKESRKHDGGGSGSRESNSN
jgi:transcriptional regulator with XRE-family HTH domain